MSSRRKGDGDLAWNEAKRGLTVRASTLAEAGERLLR
jgi:hypothetical protein